MLELFQPSRYVYTTNETRFTVVIGPSTTLSIFSVAKPSRPPQLRDKVRSATVNALHVCGMSEYRETQAPTTM